MSTVPSLAAVVRQRVADAITAALPEGEAPASVDPQLRRSDRADFQANGILGLAKQRKGNPRELGALVLEHLRDDDVIASHELSGPGFLNLTIADSAITNRVAARSADPRLGTPTAERPGTTVIDYSQPNVAKEMHVGHLRSTVIGDALTRILEFAGEKVVRRNHIGDWGTQFGMLVQYIAEHPDGQGAERDTDTDGPSMSRLNRIYRASRAKFDSDEEFTDRARKRLVALQVGDPQTLAVWQEMVEESKRYFGAVYARLDVLLEDADAVGESAYNPMLAQVCEDLENSGVAVRSEGALCVFFDDIKDPEGKPLPLIVQKSDGGYGYATTDLAAIRDRVDVLGADRMLYVVDARQALHFRMVFAAARRAGWLPDRVETLHLPFGTILGKDGKPFKTRSGDTVRLMDLLDEAVDRARAVVSEKSPQLDEAELEVRARQVGIGAVKYADLSTSRMRDYIFDADRMVALSGDTGTYLQYANARIQSILRKAPGDIAPTAHPEIALEPAERTLGLLLDEFGETLDQVAESYEPHQLCAYLHAVAAAFATFYEKCSVLKAPTQEVVENRLLFCRLAGQTLTVGMGLLGIAAPEQL